MIHHVKWYNLEYNTLGEDRKKGGVSFGNWMVKEKEKGKKFKALLDQKES